MGRRKKRGSRATGRSGGESSPSTEPAGPPASPPRRNLPLLLISIALFAAWLAILIVLAAHRWQ